MIRNATKEDIFDILVLAREFSKEAPSLYKWDKDKVEDLLEKAIDNEDVGFFVYEDSDQEIVAGLIAMSSEMFMSHKKVGTVLGWFLSKELRGKFVSLKLFQHLEEWAKDNKVTSLIMADLPEMKDLSSLYSRMGYSLTERSYVKEM